jgi:hypothetical protein
VSRWSLGGRVWVSVSVSERFRDHHGAERRAQLVGHRAVDAGDPLELAREPHVGFESGQDLRVVEEDEELVAVPPPEAKDLDPQARDALARQVDVGRRTGPVPASETAEKR